VEPQLTPSPEDIAERKALQAAEMALEMEDVRWDFRTIRADLGIAIAAVLPTAGIYWLVPQITGNGTPKDQLARLIGVFMIFYLPPGLCLIWWRKRRERNGVRSAPGLPENEPQLPAPDTSQNLDDVYRSSEDEAATLRRIGATWDDVHKPAQRFQRQVGKQALWGCSLFAVWVFLGYLFYRFG
jgi:hypothetical protein